jgi:hypothetical protein
MTLVPPRRVVRRFAAAAPQASGCWCCPPCGSKRPDGHSEQCPWRSRMTRFRRRDVANVDNRRWSLYGAPWLQPVATGRKSDRLKNSRNKRKPLPWTATRCVRSSMVRRGSTVRVRQRAPAKAPHTRAFTSSICCTSSSLPRYGTDFGTQQTKKAPSFVVFCDNASATSR